MKIASNYMIPPINSSIYIAIAIRLLQPDLTPAQPEMRCMHACDMHADIAITYLTI